MHDAGTARGCPRRDRDCAPALSAPELAAISERLAATLGFDDGSIQEPLVGRDGRQDFYHPWLYSIFAAPLVAVVD